MLYSLYETPRPLSVASEDEFVWCGWCYVWLHVYIIKYIYIYMHVEKTATAVCWWSSSFVRMGMGGVCLESYPICLEWIPI